MATKKSFTANNPALAFISSAVEEPEGKVVQEAEPKAPVVEPEEPVKEISYRSKPNYGETKSKRVQLLLQPSTVEAIKSLARSKNISMNEAVNEAILAYLKNSKC